MRIIKDIIIEELNYERKKKKENMKERKKR